MNFLALLTKTRNGESLTCQEIEEIITEFTAGRIPDYQMSAWLMAVYFRGMTREQTAALTQAMAKSGEVVDLGVIPGVKVDKHSTGGVADTVTLVLAPLVAAAGVPVAKMSGRGLGFTGGTVDKLESIPGFHTQLSREEFIHCLSQHNIALTGQSAHLAPADGKIYALRDVTATVESIPLIASSIMSKKLASGADKILLDVKVGRGAFMKDLTSARELAQTMVDIGCDVGKETVAILTDMNQPLGQAIGNSLEVAEAIEVLQGGGSRRLREAALILGSYMVMLGGQADDLAAAQRKVSDLLAGGQALAKFSEWIQAQGGESRVTCDPTLLPQASHETIVCSRETGFIAELDAQALGRLAMNLGAGRKTKDEIIQPAVGLRLKVAIGDRITTGQPLAILYTNSKQDIGKAEEALLAALTIKGEQPPVPPLVLGIVDHNGFHPAS